MSTDPGAPTGARVRSLLARRGWAWLADPISEAAFEEVAGQLGEVGLRTDIVVDPGLEADQRRGRTVDPRRPSVYQEAGIDFHTDRPSVDVIGWYCVAPDASGGANLLVDTSDLIGRVTKAELDALSQIRARYSLLYDAAEEVFAEAPLVTRDGTGVKVFYAPWQVQPPANERQAEALTTFVRYLEDKVDRECVRIRLAAGQCLFVDNHRILHARAPLPAGSRRHLVRLYIQTA